MTKHLIIALGLLVLSGCKEMDLCPGIRPGDLVKHKTLDIKPSLVIDWNGLEKIWVRLQNGEAVEMYCAEVIKVSK